MEITFEMLKNAWKQTVTQNSTELNRVRYKYYLEDHLYYLLNELNDGTFQPKPLRNKTIYIPKLRTAQVPTIDDKVIQHAICDNYLYDIVKENMIRETSACLIGRGDRYASNITINYLYSYYYTHGNGNFYVLKCDIHHYFASINHERLLSTMAKYIEDADLYNLMRKYIDMTPEVGIALGLQQSQLLANLYLNKLDRFIKDDLEAIYYARHMDDFYIISDDATYLNNCLVRINDFVQNELGLELNPKTAIFRNRFTFLGFDYRICHGKVLKSLDKGKRNTKHRHLKLLLRKLKSGDIDIEKFAVSYQGWRSHALEGDCQMLVKAWDSWLRREVEPLGYEILIDGRRVIGRVKQNTQ